MKIEGLVKVALDELRMQMLGTQVLFDFQLEGAFQDGFARVSSLGRVTDAVALGFVVLTLGLLIAVPSQHRIVDRGDATERVVRSATRYAELSLLPLALTVGCDVYVVCEPYWGAVGAAIGATATTLLSLLLWYGLGVGLRARLSQQEKAFAMPKPTPTDLHTQIDHMLTEARVILPGAQALLGFQFVVTMSNSFAALPEVDRQVHFGALAAIAFCVILLITPAAVYRLSFRGQDVPRFHRIGSFLVTLALVPLALGIAGDFHVTVHKMLDDQTVAVAGAGAVVILLALLWYGIPLFLRFSKPQIR